MKVIYKYKVTPEPDLQLPKGAEILTVGTQGHSVYLWAKVDPEAETETRRIRYVGTGHNLFEDSLRSLEYFGTVHLPDIMIVWHVFEEKLTAE